MVESVENNTKTFRFGNSINNFLTNSQKNELELSSADKHYKFKFTKSADGKLQLESA